MKMGRRSRCSLRGYTNCHDIAAYFPLIFLWQTLVFIHPSTREWKLGIHQSLPHAPSPPFLTLSPSSCLIIEESEILQHIKERPRNTCRNSEERHWALYSHDWDIQDLKEWKDLENVVFKWNLGYFLLSGNLVHWVLNIGTVLGCNMFVGPCQG